MTTVSVRRVAQAGPGRVWAVATDIDSWPETMSGIDRVEVLASPEFGVGTRWRETRTMLGKQATEEMWVSAVDEGRSYTVAAESHGTHYLSVFTVTPVGDGSTEIELTFTGEPAGRLAKVLAAVTGPLARRSVAKALARDVDDLVAVAERQA